MAATRAAAVTTKERNSQAVACPEETTQRRPTDTRIKSAAWLTASSRVRLVGAAMSTRYGREPVMYMRIRVRLRTATRRRRRCNRTLPSRPFPPPPPAGSHQQESPPLAVRQCAQRWIENEAGEGKSTHRSRRGGVECPVPSEERQDRAHDPCSVITRTVATETAMARSWRRRRRQSCGWSRRHTVSVGEW